MRRNLLAAAVIFLTGLLWAQSAGPGDAPYTPTKLEWAALELEVKYGENFSPDKHISTSFRPEDDGRTVQYFLIYDRTVSAARSKAMRDLMLMRVDDYAKHKGWDWLRVTFKEEAIPLD
jgi:hypothetical protein